MSETNIALLEQAHEALKDRHEALQKKFDAYVEKQNDINSSVRSQHAVLNLKSGAWGAIAGAVMALSALLFKLL